MTLATCAKNRTHAASIVASRAIANCFRISTTITGSLAVSTSPPPDGHQSKWNEQRPPFERIALLLQGGGALGSTRAAFIRLWPRRTFIRIGSPGFSIGAIIRAHRGQSPEERVERLREFWETITTPPFGVPTLSGFEIKDHMVHGFINQIRSLGNLLGGAPGFFKPRVPPPLPHNPSARNVLSYYDVAPLKATLERLVDFDRLNDGDMRFSVGAVNIRTGNFTYFDTTTHRIRPAHIIASGSLPPGFSGDGIDGQHYWDGGIVSNTPLEWVLDSQPRQDTLASG